MSHLGLCTPKSMPTDQLWDPVLTVIYSILCMSTFRISVAEFYFRLIKNINSLVFEHFRRPSQNTTVLRMCWDGDAHL